MKFEETLTPKNFCLGIVVNVVRKTKSQPRWSILLEIIVCFYNIGSLVIYCLTVTCLERRKIRQKLLNKFIIHFFVRGLSSSLILKYVLCQWIIFIYLHVFEL